MGLISLTPTTRSAGIQVVEDLVNSNTLISDNGAIAEGMLNGTPYEFTIFSGVPVPMKDHFL